MNKLIVDIYGLIWDDMEFRAIDSNHLFGKVFQANEFDEIDRKLR